MAKYDRLTDFLNNYEADFSRLTFHQIEKIIAAKLPRSAFTYPAWWSNDATQGRQSYGWLNAGWKTEDLDLNAKRVSFVKVRKIAR